MAFIDIIRRMLVGDEGAERPMPTPSPKRGEDQGDDESVKAYELRKAMEATAGGDTRTDRRRY